MQNRTNLPLLVTLVLVVASQSVKADAILSFKRGEITANLDVNQVPDLKQWGIKAAKLALEWHPRICNLLPTKGVVPTNEFTLRIIKSDEGIAETNGTVITVSSHWIKKHPEDIGLVIHELVHVIQNYPAGHPWWVTEGIADYVRYVVWEGKPQQSFVATPEEKGYQKGYATAAGFLFWLESDLAPGIVKRLNTSMRKGEYSDAIFKVQTGQSLDELWAKYSKHKSEVDHN